MFKPNVNSIMKSFTRMVKQLDEVIADNNSTIASTNEIIQTLQEDTMSRMAEVKRASSIKDKLNTILGE